jgi:hypothetical protein
VLSGMNWLPESVNLATQRTTNSRSVAALSIHDVAERFACSAGILSGNPPNRPNLTPEPADWRALARFAELGLFPSVAWLSPHDHDASRFS